MTSSAAPSAPPPGARRAPSVARRVYDFLVSPVLAIGVLVFVLGCCLVGVTVYRGADAGRAIFATLWFNATLVLLAFSSAAAFFSRIWKRKFSMLSAGMIVFHLSFLGVLGGVVANGLWSFRGTLRITEGETVGIGDGAAYDVHEWGRFFDPARLRGEVRLVRMHANYAVGGENKRAAYELEFSGPGGGGRKVIYITEYHERDGVRFFSLKEGYSVLVVLANRAGRELYGAHVPLQSIRQPDESYLYASGTSTEAHAFPFPPQRPAVEMGVDFFPGLVERTGKVRFQVRSLGDGGAPGPEEIGMAPVGQAVDLGGYRLSAKEIGYWVGLDVRYDPGLNTILASLTSGLVGMVMTLAGRLRKGLPVAKGAAVTTEGPGNAPGGGIA